MYIVHITEKINTKHLIDFQRFEATRLRSDSLRKDKRQTLSTASFRFHPCDDGHTHRLFNAVLGHVSFETTIYNTQQTLLLFVCFFFARCTWHRHPLQFVVYIFALVCTNLWLIKCAHERTLVRALWHAFWPWLLFGLVCARCFCAAQYVCVCVRHEAILINSTSLMRFGMWQHTLSNQTFSSSSWCWLFHFPCAVRLPSNPIACIIENEMQTARHLLVAAASKSHSHACFNVHFNPLPFSFCFASFLFFFLFYFFFFFAFWCTNFDLSVFISLLPVWIPYNCI